MGLSPAHTGGAGRFADVARAGGELARGAPIADGPISRIEWAEDQLRQALLNGDLLPGERLLTAQLSERFQVSPTPLREALHRFAGEGLVEFVPQRGARVTELSAADSRELTELRLLLDPQCVRQAVERPDETWRAEVKQSSDDLIASLGTSPHLTRDSEHAYRTFYVALTSTCESRRLRRYATAVRDQHARYRIATLDTIDRTLLAAVAAEIRDAALSGNPKQAIAAAGRDIKLFAHAYLSQIGGDSGSKRGRR